MSVDKLTKIAKRAKGSVKLLLIKKLSERDDCTQIRLSLCDEDLQKLEILYALKLKDFS